LRDGDVRAAAALMGHSWSIEGSVNHGDKRGRTIGFPTANMELGDYLQPAFGVYAVRTEILSGPLQGQIHDGVANLGLRPTVGGTAPRLETHLFDFDADLYDHELGVALLDFIRPEQKFDGLDALKAQIARDSQAARDALAAQPIK
jgi:riboflavin kinase/FMN adenylyltransferase